MGNSNRFDFARAVKDTLKVYQGATAEALSEVIPQVAKEAVQKLKQTSPRDTGEYGRHWTYKLEKGRLKCEAIVYGNKPTYRLAHLLEHGHARRGGGRDVPAIEHIAPVEEWDNDRAVDLAIEYLSKNYGS